MFCVSFGKQLDFIRRRGISNKQINNQLESESNLSFAGNITVMISEEDSDFQISFEALGVRWHAENHHGLHYDEILQPDSY